MSLKTGKLVPGSNEALSFPIGPHLDSNAVKQVIAEVLAVV